jgi:hypothetical protein
MSESAVLVERGRLFARFEIPVYVVDISRSGCGLECARELAIGTVTELEVVLVDRRCVGTIEVVRCRRTQGSATYSIGARFRTSDDGGSLLRALAELLS